MILKGRLNRSFKHQFSCSLPLGVMWSLAAVWPYLKWDSWSLLEEERKLSCRNILSAAPDSCKALPEVGQLEPTGGGEEAVLQEHIVSCSRKTAQLKLGTSHQVPHLIGTQQDTK